MATAENVKAFLAKRGYKADVQKIDSNSTYIIRLNATTVSEVEKLFAYIEEPGRFIITVKLGDVVDLVSKELKLHELSETVDVLRREFSVNKINQAKTDDELKKQAEDSLSGLDKKFTTILEDINTRLKTLEDKPWWKKW